MEPPYSLRPVRPDDHAWLLRLHHAAMREVVERVWGWDDALQDGYFQSYIERSSTALIVQAQRLDVGLFDVEPREGALFLSEIWIAPDHQGQGLGTQLVIDLQHRARAERLDVTLQVLKLNDRAQSLYERLGFEVVSETSTHRQMRRFHRGPAA